jgi:hypothetical protein
LKRHCANFILFFVFSADAAQEKEKKEKKVLLPTDVSKSVIQSITLQFRSRGPSLVFRCICLTDHRKEMI